MIKSENLQMKRKRIQCNQHGNPIKYRCENQTCAQQYLCSHTDCIDQHFHTDRLVLTKFDFKLWESKFQQVESVLNNETLRVKEEELTKLVSYFTESLQKIHKDMTKFQEVKQKICEEQVSPNPQYFQNINGFLSLSNKLQRKLDQLRAKIIDQENCSFQASPQQPNQQIQINSSQAPQKASEVEAIKDKVEVQKNRQNCEQKQICDLQQGENQQNVIVAKYVPYYDNQYLTIFLKKYIKNFEWSSTQVIFSSDSPQGTCQKFHEKLRDRRNLLFLFLGESQIIGSFYSEPYPSISERNRKDLNSFIFILDENIVEKFAIFFADSQSDSHITVSEKLLICQGNTPNNGDGLRTFQRNFESLAYFLPSLSFNNSYSMRQVTYNGMLKIKQFFILQLNQ